MNEGMVRSVPSAREARETLRAMVASRVRELAAAAGEPDGAPPEDFVARYYAHVIGADEEAARRALRELPAMLDRADELLAERTLTPAEPTAVTLQILSSIRALDAFADLRAHLNGRGSTAAAHEVFPDYPGPVPAFIPASWLAELPVAA